MNAQKIQKWTKWVERIEPDVIWLHHHRHVWREMMTTLGEQDDAEFFKAHYTRLYVDGAAMAVRRLTYDGGDDKSRSLAQLLRELAISPGLLTADRHRELYRETVFGPDGGSERFESEWGYGSGALDVELVEQDIAALAEASDSISALADRTIAHIDRRGFDGELTYGDLDRAVSEIGRVFQRCRELLLGSPLITLEPTIQGDWKAPFRAALFSDGQ